VLQGVDRAGGLFDGATGCGAVPLRGSCRQWGSARRQWVSGLAGRAWEMH
jgi:hypothetical protein